MSGAALQGIETARAREVYEFDVPKKYANEAASRTLGFVRLTGDEELEATKTARGDSVRLAFELVKLSLIEVDGKRVAKHEGQDESIWNKMRPELRQLCLAAYGELHNAEDDETEVFLKGRRTKVG